MKKDVSNVTLVKKYLNGQINLESIKEFTLEKDQMSVIFATRALIN